jgi:phosphohistidine phosphatase
MELILWRHAEAVEGPFDLQRALTRKGEKQAEKMAAFLKSHLPEHTRILVSPARRTQQTVQALTRDFITEPRLAPDARPQDLLTAAGWPYDEGCVLLVGHQPTLGQVAAQLLTDSPQAFSIKKGAIWWFSNAQRDDRPRTLLRLVMSPDLL